MAMNFEQARQNMVENQVRPWEVLDADVLETLKSVRREDFVAPEHRNVAFADLTLHSPSGVGICNDFIVRWTSYLSRQDDATVVIASRSGEYLHDSGLRFEDPQTHSVASTTADKARVWTAGLRRTLSRIAAHGNTVDLVATVPQFPGFDLRSCPSVDLWWNATGCGRVRSRSAVDAQLRVARSAEAVAVRDLRGARQVTFIDDLCSSTSCSTSRYS